MKVTKAWIDYQSAPYGKIAHIPAGIPVEPATNLPQGGYWVQPWKGMSEQAESWQRNYGFHVTEEQVTESPYCVGQRVRILPCNSWPCKTKMCYGIIHGATQVTGMVCLNIQQPYPAPLAYNAEGQWAFIVAKYASPNAGAMWFTAEGLEPMKRIVKKVLQSQPA